MQNLSIGVRGILDTPELTNDAIEHARWNPEVGCLVDQVHPNRPLLISFGFAEWKEMPNFDFFGKIKKFESQTNIKLNRILIRDIKNAWYHRGIPGLGSHVDEVVATIRGLIRSIRPSQVWTIGQSMGGYAAILFGMLLEVDRIIAFGPLSHLDPEEAIRYGERRFLPIMESLAADPPRSGYYDLVRLGKNLDYRRPIHVVFGTHPGIESDQMGNFDAIHAIRLERLANVTLHPYPDSDHLVVKWLSEQKRMQKLLETVLLDDDQDLTS
jgi:hypothetical protein